MCSIALYENICTSPIDSVGSSFQISLYLRNYGYYLKIFQIFQKKYNYVKITRNPDRVVATRLVLRRVYLVKVLILDAQMLDLCHVQ